MKTLVLLIVALMIALSIILGMRLGVDSYKAHCEVIGTSATNKWRECSL